MLVILAVKKVFKEQNFIAFSLLYLSSLWFFIYIPVRQIPGNTFSFQISLFSFFDWLLLMVLSFLTSLSLTMNYFIIKNELKKTLSAKTVGRGSFNLLSAVAGSIFGPTASCASCVGTIFGFLGVGTVFFLLKYRFAIVIVSIFIMLFTLYHSSKKVLGICSSKKHH